MKRLLPFALALLVACGTNDQVETATPPDVPSRQGPRALVANLSADGTTLRGHWTRSDVQFDFAIENGSVHALEISVEGRVLFSQVSRANGELVLVRAGNTDVLALHRKVRPLTEQERDDFARCGQREQLCYLDAADVLVQLIVHEAKSFRAVEGLRALEGLRMVKNILREDRHTNPVAPLPVAYNDQDQ